VKKLILPLLLACASSATFAADAPLTGNWQVHSSIAGNDNDQTCTFTQKDNDLTGSCTNSDKVTVNITGKVDGKKINWSYKSEYNGSPLTVQYAGTIDSANKIAGSVNVPEFSAEGDFTATQSK
jgi:hypothetical protein